MIDMRIAHLITTLYWIAFVINAVETWMLFDLLKALHPRPQWVPTFPSPSLQRAVVEPLAECEKRTRKNICLNYWCAGIAVFVIGGHVLEPSDEWWSLVLAVVCVAITAVCAWQAHTFLSQSREQIETAKLAVKSTVWEAKSL